MSQCIHELLADRMHCSKCGADISSDRSVSLLYLNDDDWTEDLPGGPTDPDLPGEPTDPSIWTALRMLALRARTWQSIRAKYPIDAETFYALRYTEVLHGKLWIGRLSYQMRTVAGRLFLIVG